MRKVLLAIILLGIVLCAPLFAEDSTSTTVTIASVVEAPLKASPSIVISFVTPEIQTNIEANTEADATVITGLNLTEDGSFTFSLMTSEEIVVTTNSTKLFLSSLLSKLFLSLMCTAVACHTVNSLNAESSCKDCHLHLIAKGWVEGETPFDFEVTTKLIHEVIDIVHLVHHQS